MPTTNNASLNGHHGHQATPAGLWLPRGLQQVEHHAAKHGQPGQQTRTPAPGTLGTSNPAQRPGERKGTPVDRQAAPSRPSTTTSSANAAGPVRPAPTPEEIRQRYEEAWAKEEARIRAAATDQPSNALGWLVAILAGVMSLEGFRLFGQLLDWPPIGTVPGIEVVIAPLVVLWFTIDVIALVAMRQWLNPAFSTATRRLGMQVSVAALGISVLINAIGHGAHGGPLAWFAVPAAALPPALLWAVLYLRDRRVRDLHQQLAEARKRHEQALERALAAQASERYARGGQGSRPVRTTSTPAKPRKSRNTAAAGKTSNPDKPNKSGQPGKSDAELVAALRALDAEYGRPVGHHIAMKALGIGRGRFDRIRNQVNSSGGAGDQTTSDRADTPTND